MQGFSWIFWFFFFFFLFFISLLLLHLLCVSSGFSSEVRSLAAEPREPWHGLIFRTALVEGGGRREECEITISIQLKALEAWPRAQSESNIWKQFSQRGSCHLGWKVGEGKEVFSFLLARLISPTENEEC